MQLFSTQPEQIQQQEIKYQQERERMLKQEIKKYLDEDYCCEFKEECKEGIRTRCAEYEAKLYLILRYAEPREKRIEELKKNLKLWTDTKEARETIFFQQKRKIADIKKENKLLGEQCNQLLKDKGELTDKLEIEKTARIANVSRIYELEQQIEKMKCCENCKFKRCNKSSQYQTCWYCKNKDKWQLGR